MQQKQNICTELENYMELLDSNSKCSDKRHQNSNTDECLRY